MDTHDLVIAGSGVAGLLAAVYAARADIENYLGFPEGVGGMELIQRGKEQAEQFGAEFQHGRIVDSQLDDQPFELELESGDTFGTRALIVARGWFGDPRTPLRGSTNRTA